jgi:hypothetical protein
VRDFHLQARWHDATITKAPTQTEYAWQCRVDGHTYVGEAAKLKDAKGVIQNLFLDKIQWKKR